MWLRDRLPQDVPQVRSLIYGYDTKLFRSHSFQDLDDIAKWFIASLKEICRSSFSTRSLIFLAHSLGGIVLKRALVLMAQKHNNVSLQNVKGVVFFGVPHKGMEVSHLLAMAEKQPNEDLISSCLTTNSALLPELHKEFEKVTLSINQNIRFVYETLESPLTEASSKLLLERCTLMLMQLSPTGDWVRSKDSYAVLVRKDSSVPAGTPIHHALAVNDDHSNMVKFAEDDPVCQVILSLIYDLSKPDHSQALQAWPLVTANQKEGFAAMSDSFATTRDSLKAFSNVPFPRDPCFVGRQHILAQLESEFADPKSQNWVSLHGLGGIG